MHWFRSGADQDLVLSNTSSGAAEIVGDLEEEEETDV